MKRKVLGLMGLILAMAVFAGCATGSQSGAMVYSEMINASPERIWEVMCNPPDPDWAPAVKKAGNEKGKTCELGWSIDQNYNVLGQSYKVTTVLTEAVPNQKAVLKMGGDFSATMTTILSPEGKSTRVTVIWEVAGTLPAGMSFDVAKGQLERETKKSLDNFRRMAEE